MGPRRRARQAAAATLVGALTALAACTSSEPAAEPAPSAGSETGTTTSVPSSAEPSRARLRVMSFNIEYGGTGVAFSSVPRAVRAARADVVAVNEGYGNIARLARALHWPYYDISTQVVSRLPLLTPPGSEASRLPVGAPTTDGRAVLVEVSPGRVAAVVNVHLPASPYSPFKAQQGTSAAQIRRLERQARVSALQRPLRTARRFIGDAVPTFVLGDFNSPSDLDWTPATVGLRDQVRFALHWPATAAAEASGLVDSYREVHPDPVADPGLTWPASRPFVKGYNPGPAGQAADRIDLLFSGGPARVTSSQVVGERGSAADIVVPRWPTDHRAVVSGFSLTPAPVPALVSVRPRLVDAGARLRVDYSAPGSDARAVVVSPSAPGTGRSARAAVDPPGRGTVTLGTGPLEPGRHQASLVRADGSVIARTALWVRRPGAAPTLRSSRGSYGRGRGIGLSWSDAPGDRNDWLAVFRRGGVPGTDSYLGWTYIGPRISGSVVVDRAVRDVRWPLPVGRYTAYLLKDDGYDVLARADFRVSRPRSTVGGPS